jgi:hypothetical protein
MLPPLSHRRLLEACRLLSLHKLRVALAAFKSKPLAPSLRADAVEVTQNARDPTIFGPLSARAVTQRRVLRALEKAAV